MSNFENVEKVIESVDSLDQEKSNGELHFLVALPHG
jgi:hypothetical protein